MTGMRWFSISSLRKLTTIGSASVTARSSPSCFSAVEKYGEKKNVCSSRDVVERVGERAELVAHGVELVLLLRDLEQRAGVDRGDLFHR